jgi:hypothetical protein
VKTEAICLALNRWPYGLEVQSSAEGLLLRPRQKARANWGEAFKKANVAGEDRVAMSSLCYKFDATEWEW